MRPTVAKESDGRVPAEGTSLHYVVVGEGSPVVVVHGGPGLGHYYLRPETDVLADRHRLVYYDQRGSGRSDAGEPGYVTLSGAIDDLEALRAGLGLERISLLGHSFGANLAALYAALYPARVASIVLANPGPPFDPAQQAAMSREMQRRMRPEDVDEIARIRRSPEFERRDPKALERFFRTMYVPFFRDPSSADRLDLAFTEGSAAGLVGLEERWMAELSDFDAAERIASVKAPALVVHGEQEPIPVEFARSLAEAIPSAYLEVIDGANHFACLEDPEPFFALVGAFLGEEAG